MRHRWYWFLFSSYLAMELAGAVELPGAPWLAAVSRFSALPMAILLFFLVEGAASRGEELKERVDSAEKAGRDLADQLNEVSALRAEGARLRDEIGAIRQKLRVDDSL